MSVCFRLFFFRFNPQKSVGNSFRVFANRLAQFIAKLIFKETIQFSNPGKTGQGRDCLHKQIEKCRKIGITFFAMQLCTKQGQYKANEYSKLFQVVYVNCRHRKVRKLHFRSRHKIPTIYIIYFPHFSDISLLK